MRALCEQCQRPQPSDWVAGQVCVHCGSAVRAEQRCAACARWTPAARFCRACAAELVPEEWYGVGRMLVQAGVDALSLAERVRALDPAQRETFSARFAAQRGLVEQLVAQARFCEGFLVTRGHADRLEEELVSALPVSQGVAESWGRAGPGPWDAPEQLETVRTQALTWQTRGLAALAQLRRLDVRREVLSDALSHLEEQGELGVEAALAFLRADWLGARDVLPRWRQDTLKVLLARAQAALPNHPEVAAARAIWLARTTSSEKRAAALERDGLVAPLREGLASPDEGLRFSCALLLEDGAALDAFVGHPRFKDAALRALGGADEARLLRRLAEAPDDAARTEALRALGTPGSDAAFTAVVEVVRAGGDAVRDRALRALAQTSWDAVGAGARDRLAEWVGRQALAPDRALELLRWAVNTKDRERPYRAWDEVQAFAVAAARALDLLPATRKTVDLHGVDELFAVAADGAPLALVLKWAQDPQTSQQAFEHIFNLQARLDGYAKPPDLRGLRLLLSLWERLGDSGRAAVLPTLAEVLRRSGGSASRRAVLEALWRRFLDHPTERAALWQVTSGVRRELEEVRQADPRAAELDGGDPARRFAVYGRFEPLEAPPLLRQLFEAHADHPSMRTLTPLVLELAQALFARGEHRHAMWLAGSYASEVVNRFRDDDTREAWREVALGLALFVTQVEQARAQTRPKDPGDSLATFEQQLETELRLAREVVEREEERAEREREREREKQRRADEAARRAAEQAEEARRREREAAEQLAQAKAALEAARPPAGDAAAALDTEVLVPDQPIRTLADYVAFMRAMQRGADVMALFAQHGLTPVTWGACATAWAQVMTKRMDVAMRFAELLR